MLKKVETKFFNTIGSSIICKLCQHYCKLRDGQTGICGVNKNLNGELINMVYGKLVAVHVDPIEKKPLYHFLPGTKTLSIGTLGCNMQCPFCQNWHISQVRDNVDKTQSFSPESIVAAAIKNKCKSIAYTYNEPTIFYPFAKDVAIQAKKYNIKNIFVTNGIESKELIYDMVNIIDACNLDFKSFNPEFYKKVLKAPFGILESMKLMQKLDIWLETTTLIVPHENDSDEELNQIAHFIANSLGTETPWHISAFFPNYKMNDKSATSIYLLEKAYKIGMKNGLKHIYIGNTNKRNITFCPNCNSPIIERKRYQIQTININNGQCQICKYKISGHWQ